MVKRNFLVPYAVAGLAAIYSATNGRADLIGINEVVTDPQADHNHDGIVSDSDEFVELKNFSNSSVDLTGWLLSFIDTTPDAISLFGTLDSGAYLVIQNPPGAINNNGRIEVYDNNNSLVHGITFGNWDDGNISDNWPSGNAIGLSDESLSAYPDMNNYLKTYATRGYENGPEPRTSLLVGVGLVALLAKERRR